MLDEQIYPDTTNRRIADGMSVLSTDGEKLGTVRNYDPQAGYLDVQQGWLFKKDIYAPLDQVDAVTEEGVVLKLTKDELADDRYLRSPVSAAARPEPVVLTDGTVIGTGETTAGTREDDGVHQRSVGTSLADVPDRPVGAR